MRGHIPGPPGTLADADLGVAGPLARDAGDLEAALDVLAGPDEARAVAWKLALPPPRRTRAARLPRGGLARRSRPRRSTPSCARSSNRSPSGCGARASSWTTACARSRIYARCSATTRSSCGRSSPAGSPRINSPATCAPPRARPPTTRAATRCSRAARPSATATGCGIDEWRARYRARWAELFRDFDVVLCPIMPTAALPHDHREPAAARTHRRQRRAARLLGPVDLGRGDHHRVSSRHRRPGGAHGQRAAGRPADRRSLPRRPDVDRLRAPARRRRRRIRAAAGLLSQPLADLSEAEPAAPAMLQHLAHAAGARPGSAAR